MTQPFSPLAIQAAGEDPGGRDQAGEQVQPKHLHEPLLVHVHERPLSVRAAEPVHQDGRHAAARLGLG